MSDMCKGWGDPVHFLPHLEAGNHVSSLWPEEPSFHVLDVRADTYQLGISHTHRDTTLITLLIKCLLPV